MSTIDPTKMAHYRETARRRQAEREQALQKRHQQALALAHEAVPAFLLRPPLFTDCFTQNCRCACY
jgi:hypothetical protein